MKKIHILIAAIGFAFAAQGCVQTVSPAAGSCPPAGGGTLQDLTSSCFGATIAQENDFSIHLESVRVFAGQTLEVIAMAKGVAETSGWKFAFTGTTGKVRVSKLGTGQAMDSLALDMTDGKTWCFDIHANNAEDPHHLIFWRGNGPTTQISNYGNAAFNRNSEAAATSHSAGSTTDYGTGMNGTNFAGGATALGTKVLYKADAGTTSSITVKSALTSGL